jgi:hypothetical protein
MRPLCGFSHGAAGIGFVFLEVGHYFKNPAFYRIAEQAFAYEDQFFNASQRNWTDFRVKMYTPQQLQYLEDRYRRGIRFMAPQAKDIFVWCHGAAGIGMSRQRAYELTGDDAYLETVTRARSKIRIVKKYPFTLCHGHGGNAELYIGERGAQERARAALREKRLTGVYRDGYNTGSKREDMSLMNGIAGIGYFMLRVHDSSQTPSILMPSVAAESKIAYDYTPARLRRMLIENSFPRTIRELAANNADALEAYFMQDKIGIEPFADFVEKHILLVDTTKRQTLKDVLVLELTKARFDEVISNQAEIYIASRVQHQDAAQIIDKPLIMFQVLQLSGTCKIIQTQTLGVVLIRQTPSGVTEQQISPFCAAVLLSYTRAKTIEKALRVINKEFGTQQRSTSQINQAALQQMQQALQHGILVAKMPRVVRPIAPLGA